MLENAVRICDAKFGNIYRWDGEVLRILASLNTPPALAEARRHSAVRPTSQVRRMVETKTTTHVADVAADPGYIERRFPAIVDAVELGGVRTFLTVPMVKENELVGSFSLYRQEVRPFTDKQIALVTNFAAQAVIAIENARLLNELRQRTDELSRSVGELRALGEVSQAVNSTLDLETGATQPHSVNEGLRRVVPRQKNQRSPYRDRLAWSALGRPRPDGNLAVLAAPRSASSS
jgi:GAF domain-containing protein